MKTLFGIQYLRGLAAVAVVCFHAITRSGGQFLVGEAGVDLFFVLSGFLMVEISSPETRPLRFLRNRAARIVPPYWIATSIFLLAAVIGVLPGVRLEPWHVVSSYLFLPSRMPGSPEIWPLLVPGWTLNFEAFFYVLFAGALIAPHRWRLTILTVLLVGLVALGVVLRPTGIAATFYTQPILLEFLAGAWLGAWHRRRGPLPAGWLQIAAAFVLYLLAYLVNSDALRVLSYGVPALLLLSGILHVEHGHGLPEWGSLKLVGDASYSIYLWHTMVLSVALKIAHVAHLPRAATVALAVVAGIAGGLLAYRIVERPLLRWFKQRRTRLGIPNSGV